MAFSLSQPEARRLADEVTRGQLALDPLLDEARAGRDVDRTAALLLVRTAAGRPPSTDEVHPLLPDASMQAFLPLIAAAQGDRVALLLDAVEHDRMSNEREALSILVVTQLLEGKAPPPRLAALLRRCARDCVSDEALACIEAAADALGDPDARAVVQAHRELAPLETVRRVARSVRAVLADPLSGLGEETERVVASGFTARRVQPKAGRNDPCPCGSGKKYKKCHMAQDEASVPSPLQSKDAAQYAPALDRMSPDEVKRMGLPELAALDLGSLKPPALEAAFHRLASFHRFEPAERAITLMAANDPERADEMRALLIGDALHAGEVERAERLRAQMINRAGLVPSDQLSIALLRKDPEALAVIEELARRGLADERGPELIELAYALIDRLPALGILVGRGALTARRQIDSETLLDEIERARDKLGIAPWDPSGEAYDEQVRADAGEQQPQPATPPTDPGEKEQEAAAMRERLARANQRMAEYERLLHEQERRLASAHAQLATPAPDGDEARRLRVKVTELKGQIAEGNRERADLRTELQRASQGAAVERPAAARREPSRAVEESDDLGAAVDAPREALVPDFTAALAAGMASLPARVQRAVVLRVADAAAGDPSAWRQIKQMNDLEPPLLTLRIGLHHRALMRVAAGVLTIYEVVTREEFDTTLKRYRR